MVTFTDHVKVEGEISATEQGLEKGSVVILDDTGHIQEILLPMTYTQTILEPGGWTLTGVNYFQDMTVPGISQLVYPTISDMASSDAQRDAVANGNIYVQTINAETEVVRFISQQYRPTVSLNIHIRGMKGEFVPGEFVSEFGQYRRAFTLTAGSTIPPTAGTVLTSINEATTALQTQIDDKLGLHATADRAIADADGNAISTTYQRVSGKSTANGYASLDATTKVPIAELPTGNANHALISLSEAVGIGQYVSFDGTGFKGATLGNVLTYKGTVASFSDLPANANTGDVWNVTNAYGTYPAGTNFAWDGTQWDGLGGTVDLSPYQTKSNLITAFQSVPDDSHYVSEKLIWDRLTTKENVANKTATFQSTPSDVRYPTEKLVKDSLDAKLDDSQLVSAFQPITTNAHIPSEKLVKDSLDAKLDDSQLVVAFQSTPSDVAIPSEKLVKDSLDAKQNNLTYDGTPTDNSLNMVRSGAIKSALDLKVDDSQVVTAFQPTPSNSNIPSEALVKTSLDGKIDDTQLITAFQPTVSDTHIPSEKLVKDSLDAKQNRTQGTADQYWLGGTSGYGEWATLESNVSTGNQARAPTCAAIIGYSQPKLTSVSNTTISSWVASSPYPDYPHTGRIVIPSVTSNSSVTVVFPQEFADRGIFASTCDSGEGFVEVYAKINTVTVNNITVNIL